MPRETVRMDDREVRRFFKDFKEMPKEVQRQARPMLRATAKEPLQRVRRNASWSTRIPNATRVGLSFGKRFQGVRITVNKRAAPHARPFENKGKPGKFRHRVFGQNVWVSETARPFFYEVAPSWHNNVNKGLGDVVDRVTKEHGFK